MKQVNSLKFWHGLLFMLMMVSFTACVDDNEDTEAPFLEVNPATLTFENGGVQTLEISTNRQWKATVEDADWISLSKIQGEGSDQIQVSVPEGTIGEAKINIIMSNRSGILKSATVNVKAGTVIESKLIYNETLGNADASQKPYISDYQGWNKSGDGATSVEYAGNKTSIRSSGLTNTDAYEGASGPNVVFFAAAPATFDINKIALAEGQTNLKLTFGASRSKQNEDKSYDNSFTPEAFKVSVSSNGTTWQEITYEKNNGDADHPYWILATANFTLKKAVPELYIRFTASESSVFRLDDISLSTGYGGQEVNLEGGNEPTITSVDPKTITFTDKGGNQDVKVTLANAEGKSLTVSGLSGILSATVNGTTVTVTANPNTTEAAVKQTLTIKIEGTEQSVEVPVTVSEPTSGNQETLTIDFTSDNSYPANFPLSAQKKQQRENFTIDNVEIAIMGESSGYYKVKSGNSSYLLIGKAGAYIEFPNIKDKRLTQVKAISRTGASTNVEVGITDTNNSFITGGETQKWNNTTDFTYIYNLSGTSINTNYRLYVNNSYNTQLTKLELLYE
ncbi:BACON domain-containing protein [Phocaeicola plebeius]|uniref:BACON domain-containing protein n=1 Tax=Phocaeicola plebeius TaxID=310297 RepID=UPI0026EB99FC|nr:BACON domain-containing protein [Phocaeicola plebeius]